MEGTDCKLTSVYWNPVVFDNQEKQRFAPKSPYALVALSKLQDLPNGQTFEKIGRKIKKQANSDEKKWCKYREKVNKIAQKLKISFPRREKREEALPVSGILFTYGDCQKEAKWAQVPSSLSTIDEQSSGVTLKLSQVSGWGRMTLENGGYYDGEIQNGLPHGLGKLYTPSSHYNPSTVYIGEFDEARKQGLGWEWTSEWKKGEETTYIGQWREDKKEGRGILRNAFGDTVYDGEWKKDKKHGKGKSHEDRGDYDGFWENDKKRGTGTFFYDPGYRYGSLVGKFQGEWRDDKPFSGTETLRSGKTREVLPRPVI